MKISNTSIVEHRSSFLAKGYSLPVFNRDVITDNTAVRPVWIHFGAGNIFRAFISALNQNLLDRKSVV